MIWLLFKNHHLLRMPQIPVKQEFLWLSILVAGALFFILNLMLYGLQYPHGRPDAWINWNVVARFIYLGDADWQATFLRQWDHPDYPLLMAVTHAITWVFAREATTWGPIAFHFVISFFTMGLLFALVHYFRDFKQAVLAVVIFASHPFLIDQGMRQYADMLLAYLILAAGGLGLLYVQKKDMRLAILAGLFVGLSGWAKNEGLAAIAAFSVVWVWIALRAERTAFKHFILGSAFPLLITVFFKLFLAPSNDLISAQQSGSFEKLLDVERYILIFQKAGAMLWNLGDAPISLFGLIILLALIMGRSANRTSGTWTIAIPIGLQAVVYFMIYLLTPLDLTYHLNTSADRLYMHVLPLAFLWLFTWIRSPQETSSKES
jgi:hypothetical protein